MLQIKGFFSERAAYETFTSTPLNVTYHQINLEYSQQGNTLLTCRAALVFFFLLLCFSDYNPGILYNLPLNFLKVFFWGEGGERGVCVNLPCRVIVFGIILHQKDRNKPLDTEVDFATA